MHSHQRPSRNLRVSLPLILLGIFLISLWVAGGASRADLLGQAVVRGVASILLVAAIMFGPRPSMKGTVPVLTLVGLALGLALVQLIPLPPGLWQALPGRDVLTGAASIAGQPQPWRPWTMVPQGTVNAAASLLVPLTVCLLVAQLSPEERVKLPSYLLAFVAASMAVGMLQFTSVMFDNIFINENPNIASGTFANRNHFALLLALGCLLAPVWALSSENRIAARTTLAAGLVLLFFLALLATGSRAGLLLGPIGVVLGLVICAPVIRRSLRHQPRWTFPALVGGIGAIILLCVIMTILMGRSESIDRLVATEEGQEMRLRGLPVVLEMVRHYFPFGTGLGGFDPLFRMHEPHGLLKPTFFNHAHNDLLEVAVTAGLPGILLLMLAVGWWAKASFTAWRMPEGAQGDLAKLGSGMLLLVLLASIFDYPARTPIIMAVIVIAAFWLSGAIATPFSPLPKQRVNL